MTQFPVGARIPGDMIRRWKSVARDAGSCSASSEWYVALAAVPVIFVLAASIGVRAADAPRPMSPEDITAFHSVSAPQISPDGERVAFTVESSDPGENANLTTLWWVRWDGSGEEQLTFGPHSVSRPQWSPGGKWLSFTSSRPGPAEGTQVWALPRSGGEARQLTDVKGELGAFAWSPDGKRLAIVFRRSLEDPDEPRPWVIDRYVFKGDDDGYYVHPHPWNIYLFDLESKALTALTRGDRFEEYEPAWSPDGTMIAFESYRSDSNIDYDNADVWVADARGNADPVRLTSHPGADTGPLSWSPDGKRIAYVQGPEPRLSLYGPTQAAVVSVDDKAHFLPTETLDLDTRSPLFDADGRSIHFVVRDDQVYYPARAPVTGGRATRLLDSDGVVTHFSLAGDRMAVRYGTPARMFEIHALDDGRLRRLSHRNDEVHKRFLQGDVQRLSFTASDEVRVSGLLTLPPDYRKGRRYPAIAWIHGGPYGQDKLEFDATSRIFAAAGYAVVQVNYRGSAGRGARFATTIAADWGNRDMVDVLEGVDHAIQLGIADPGLLGVGGWSQGGLITNFIITETGRFRAAVAGAGTGNQIGMYGADWYVHTYDYEFGPPWEDTALWMRMSRPLLEADRIETPTLYIVGEKDFNVPVIGSEQMYQALRSQNVPTQLVIYPGERHAISSPRFRRDRMRRYVEWYDRYLKTP